MKQSDRFAATPSQLFTIRGARPLTQTPLQPHSVWLGEKDNHVYGVISSPVASSGGMPTTDLQRHALLGSIQRCYVSEDFTSLLGSGPVDIAKIFDDLALIGFGSATVQVHGHPVRGCTLEYEGVSFVGGYDPIRWPFVIARRSSSPDAWPELVRVGADRLGDDALAR